MPAKSSLDAGRSAFFAVTPFSHSALVARVLTLLSLAFVALLMALGFTVLSGLATDTDLPPDDLKEGLYMRTKAEGVVTGFVEKIKQSTH